MKINKKLIMGGAAASLLALTGCSDWLDVNVDPNNPTDQSADYSQRLASEQFYLNHACQIGAQATTMICGDMLHNTRTNNYGRFSEWQMSEARSTTCYQWFYVGCAANFRQSMASAERDGAYHYLGANYVLKAMGFALMNDLHGEVPYSDALGENVLPTYDTGKEIFVGIVNDLDKAIEYLQKPQAEGAKPLAANDSWNGGDAAKWLKMAYLLKARMLNHLVKKGDGKWDPENGQYGYDADLILDCLAKAHQSNADNTVIEHGEGGSTTQDHLGWAEPVDYSPLYSVLGMNSNYFFTKTVEDNLTNFNGQGVEDPRADRILPWARSMKTASTPADIKWSNDGKWRRSKGFDMVGYTRTANAPLVPTWGKPKTAQGHTQYTDADGKVMNSFFIDSDQKERHGDTIYVQERCDSKEYRGSLTRILYLDNTKGKGEERSSMSGTFMTRASSPGFVAMYHEACFIKAEVLMRKGDKAGAFAAYKEGIKAHMDAMNVFLKKWRAEENAGCPTFEPMTDTEINNYLANGIGTANDITLGKIMTQKGIAMMCTVERWNDMRKYDFNPQIFMNWNRPASYLINATAQTQIPQGKCPRRWRISSHEYNYNVKNLTAVADTEEGKALGMNAGYEGGWFNALDMWSIPVWWDSNLK